MSKTQLNQIIIVILIGAILGGIILIWDKDMSPVIDSDVIKIVIPKRIKKSSVEKVVCRKK